jgi:hypothetical protein
MNMNQRPTKLLGVSTDAKTVKGEKKGVLTGIMYLAPHKASGQNVCIMAEMAGCVQGCLNTAGRGAFSNVQMARVRKTNFWHEDKQAFLGVLRQDIRALAAKANRLGLTPMVRLNGTSDIRWEQEAPELLEEFSDIQFYDYTKIPTRRNLPRNYHLTFSYSGANPRYADFYRPARENGMNIAVVFRNALPDTFLGMPVINGDESDVRPYDPQGVIVGLKAKGKARYDTSGFVVG